MIERPRCMEKVEIERDPKLEEMIKLGTTSRKTKRELQNTNLEKTEARKDNLNFSTTSCHPTEKLSLNKSRQKRKSGINNVMDINHGASIVVQRNLPHTNVTCNGLY